jgi:hypothetical protein
MAGNGRIVLEFAAELGDVCVDGPADDRGGVAPHFSHELEARDDGAAGAKKSEKQAEFLGSKLHAFRSAADRAGSDVDFDFAEVMNFTGLGRRVAGRLRATKEGFDAGKQFEKAEWFSDVIVGAQAQAANLIRFFAFGGEKKNRSRVAILSERFQDPEAVELGEHDVENDEVGLGVGEGFQAGDAVAGDFYVVAFDL